MANNAVSSSRGSLNSSSSNILVYFFSNAVPVSFQASLINSEKRTVRSSLAAALED